MDFTRQLRESVDGAVEKLSASAADQKTAMAGLAVLGVAALAVALVALAVAMRKD